MKLIISLQNIPNIICEMLPTGRTKEGEREGAVSEGEGGVGGKKEERGEVHASSARGRPSSPIPGPLWGVNHRG